VWPDKPAFVGFDVYSIAWALVQHFKPDLAEYAIPPNMNSVSAVSFIVALMISFRLRESCRVWYEARSMWGQLITDCTSLCRFNANYIAFKAGHENAIVKNIFALTMALPLLLKNFLRGETGRDAEHLAALAGVYPDVVKAIFRTNVPTSNRCRWA
jgi:predicted membrane chloride channel (bestrophin family)